MKIIKFLLIIIGLATVVFFVTVFFVNIKDQNLIQENAEQYSMLNKKSLDYKAMKILFDSGCSYCHTNYPQSSIEGPADKKEIASIAQEAISDFNMTTLLATIKDNHLIPLKKLDDIQEVLENDSMPPPEFLVLHWASAISVDEKKVLYEWITEKKAQRQAANLTN